MTRPSVYRVYDADDQLLYLGTSGNVYQRLVQGHQVEARWWKSVHHITVEHHATTESARSAEAAAIASEQPLFNHDHTGRGVRARYGSSHRDLW